MASIAARLDRLERSFAPEERPDSWQGHERIAYALAHLWQAPAEWIEDLAWRASGGVRAFADALGVAESERLQAITRGRFRSLHLHTYAQFEEYAAAELGIDVDAFRGEYAKLLWLMRLTGAIVETDPARCFRCWGAVHNTYNVMDVPREYWRYESEDSYRRTEMRDEQIAAYRALAGGAQQ